MRKEKKEKKAKEKRERGKEAIWLKVNIQGMMVDRSKNKIKNREGQGEKKETRDGGRKVKRRKGKEGDDRETVCADGWTDGGSHNALTPRMNKC